MDAKLATLGLILERMNVLYERVISILGRERTCLISMDFDALLVEMREKDEVHAALRGLDRDRLRIQDQFAILMGKDPEEVSLRTLCESLFEQGGQARETGMRLMDLRERMSGTVALLKEKIESNSHFIERSVENIQGVAAHFSATVTGRASRSGRAMNVYNGKARYQENAGLTGTIVEKRL